MSSRLSVSLPSSAVEAWYTRDTRSYNESGSARARRPHGALSLIRYERVNNSRHEAYPDENFVELVSQPLYPSHLNSAQLFYNGTTFFFHVFVLWWKCDVSFKINSACTNW